MRMRMALILLALVSTIVSAKTFPEPETPVASWKEWTEHPDYIFDAKWIRGPEMPAQVVDGVCYLFYPDKNDTLLYAADAQVDACIVSGKLKVPAERPAGTQRVHLFKTQTQAEVYEKALSIFGVVPEVDPKAKGFYKEKPTGECMIVSHWKHYTFGHELKHCYDGRFHSDKDWKPVPLF
jgi:hypothetical protein